VKERDQFLSRWFNGKNKRLRSNEVTTVINEAVVFFGLDDDFMSHSLRLGGITAKCRAGCNPSETRKVAGFKDDSKKVMEIFNRINTHDKEALASVDDSVSHHSQGDSF